MSTSEIISQFSTRKDIAHLIERLSATSPSTLISRCALTFSKNRDACESIVAAIASFPREHVFLDFAKKKEERFVIPESAKSLQAEKLVIGGAKFLPGVPLGFKASHLELKNCAVGDGDSVIEFGESLTRNLRFLVIDSPEMLVHFPKFVRLESLECKRDDCLSVFPVESVERLTCSVSTKDGVKRLGSAIAKMPLLRELKITMERKLAENVFEMLRDSNAPKLRILTLIGIGKTDEERIEWFPALPKLQILQMSKFRFTAPPEELFAALPLITGISLQNTKMAKPRESVIVVDEEERQSEANLRLDEKSCSKRLDSKRAMLSKTLGIKLGKVKFRVLYDSN